MKYLLIREFGKWKKNMLADIIIAISLPLLSALIYVAHGEYVVKAVEWLYSAPGDIFSFLGIKRRVSADNVTFYLAIAYSIEVLVITWRSCMHVIDVFLEDELNGNMFFICDQMYSRKLIYAAKCIWSVFSAVCAYVFMGITMMICIIADSGKQAQCISLQDIFPRYGLGIVVTVMFICLMILYVVYSSAASESTAVLLAQLVMFLSLCMGNLYKFVNALKVLLSSMGKNVDIIDRLIAGLKELYWLSPLSWCNINPGKPRGSVLIQLGLCFVVICITLEFGLSGYKKRKFI